MPDRHRALSEIVRGQHGVISRAQVRAVGLSDGFIASRVKRAEWERVEFGVYRILGVDESWTSRLMATCLALDAVASHRAAAVLWGIWSQSRPPIEVTVGRHQSRSTRADPVVVHETTQWRELMVVERDGIPCTDADRTILDLAGVTWIDQLNHAVDEGIRKGLVTYDSLVAVLRRHCRRGRNGCGPLRALLEERVGERQLPDSHWNRQVGRLLVEAGLPEPVLEHGVHVGLAQYRIDIAYPHEKVAVELDSVRWHLNRASFDADPVKRNDLTRAGWAVLTFTHRFFRERPNRLVAMVREALEARSGSF